MQNELDLAWLGGIIDGEGCIGTIHHRQKRGGRLLETWRPHISITNTDPLITERSASILERNGVPSQLATRLNHGTNWKPVMRVQIIGLRRVAQALPVILPYVYGKAAQLDLLARIVESRLATMAGPRAPRSGGGSILPGFTDVELQWVEDIRRLNECGREIQGRRYSLSKSERA